MKHLTSYSLVLIALATLSQPGIAATRVLKKTTATPVEQKVDVPADTKIIPVSDYELTMFVFPKKIDKKLLLQNKTAILAGKPEYFAGYTQVALQFVPSTTPVQMLVPFEDGSVQSYSVMPKKIPGRVIQLGYGMSNSKWIPKPASKSEDTTIEADGDSKAASPFNEDITLLRDLVATGKPSPDFEKVALPRPVAYDLFTVVPMSAWSNGNKRIMTFQLVANGNNTAVVSNTQFYREGINAVLVTGDVVDSQNSPLLYVVEELQ